MKKHKTKYIFVTGGVVSSLGKGIASASIGRLRENEGPSKTKKGTGTFLLGKKVPVP